MNTTQPSQTGDDGRQPMKTALIVSTAITLLATIPLLITVF